MALHFISDLHLDPAQPAVRERFLAYLAGPARQAQALYILGDLFEVWAGDDASMPDYAQEIAGLRALAAHGVAVYFLPGNRDFLCGRDFADAAAVQLIDEPALVGNDIVLLHGDVLCTQDVAYQRFRRIVRMPWLQGLYRRLPRSLKRRIAHALRGKTQAATRLKPQDILDVCPAAVDAFMRAHPDRRMLIHGHTHRPADHVVADERWRLVLSDWTEQHGEYLSVSDGHWQRTVLD